MTHANDLVSGTEDDNRTTTPSPTPTSTPSSRSSLPSSTDTSPTPTPSSDCPQSNLTVYTSEFTSGSQGPITSSMGLSFQKQCSIDPTGNNIAEVAVASFERCIELCASLNFWANNKDCVGVSFSRESGTCWAHDTTERLVSTDATDGALLWEQ
ncbi:hypothetical protein F5Y08DRAFT_341974 [Xylaria arbuscula]|nr:hypothetical protein F5Y08DRAFT_341974 [Xylaria arbuscula]